MSIAGYFFPKALQTDFKTRKCPNFMFFWKLNLLIGFFDTFSYFILTRSFEKEEKIKKLYKKSSYKNKGLAEKREGRSELFQKWIHN
jgi:hypothetical protein